MSDNRNCLGNHSKEEICIDTYRVLDSCRDKDCFENVKVYLTDLGEEIIERTTTIRAKYAKIVSAYIDINDVPFNRGFYQLNIKIFIKIVFEACISPNNVQEFEGIAVVEKKVILFGSEGNVKVFKSETGKSGFCSSACEVNSSNSSPIAVLETVDPVILNWKIVGPRECACLCCCCIEDIPEKVIHTVNGCLHDRNDRILVVSLGLFSVVKIERPAQIIVSATEYNIPDKECVVASEDDPCKLFKSMAFPISEFSPPTFGSCGCSVPPPKRDPGRGSGCGCN